MNVNKKHQQKDRNTLNIIFKTIVFSVLLLYALTIIYLLFWGLLTSLKANIDFTTKDNKFGFPNLEYSREEFFKLKNYKLILEKFEFDKSIGYYWNGILVEHTTRNTLLSMTGNALFFALVQAVLPTLMSAIMAYLCARFSEFKSIVMFYYIALVTMMIPSVGTYAAEISLLQSLGVYDTYLGYVLQKSYYGGTYFFVFYAFFKSMSNTYAEAAELDGASQYRVFFQIVLPLMVKTFSTIALIQFVSSWNDFRVSLLYMPTHPSVAYGVYHLTLVTAPAGIARVPTRVAACMLLAVPLLIIFLFFKEKLMGNISMGGLKE